MPAAAKVCKTPARASLEGDESDCVESDFDDDDDEDVESDFGIFKPPTVCFWGEDLLRLQC